MICEPEYLLLHRSGELARRIEAAHALLSPCRLCPRECGVDRLSGEEGFCRSGIQPKVASWTLHPWEEPPISGTRGSGTIFFSGCTGRCLFCQNYPISQLGVGNVVTVERLAEMMAELQQRGAHNINLVTPTHFVPQILAALPRAIEMGLRLPLVYNSSGYESIEVLRLLDGVVDLWLPDAKYADDDIARRLSGFPHYVEDNRAALREMYRQVGDELLLDDEGLARRGLIIRHMVLPGRLSGTREVLNWIASELSPRVHVSLMAQYFPAYRAVDHPILGRKLTVEEYEEALAAFDEADLERGWCQEQEM
ncbi:MAG: radical SAM protein [Anaerolineae bacterium]|jgi:putative pyruvate formate lyase activating enzyme|nr:radical SAM protein [Anaerolineae bacterium]MDH7473080.1 radical SAM protein [Anaerolineae bacterium]